MRGTLAADVCWFLPKRCHPKDAQLARGVAITAGVLVAVSSAVAGDPYDGAFRGILEALCCYGGYCALGRYLGIRDAGVKLGA